MTGSLSPLGPLDVLRILSKYRWVWIVPTLLATIVAVAYTFVRTPTWEATQALVVRNQAHGAGDRPGKFVVPDEMKTTQETILELAKSHSVLASALRKVGPTAHRVGDAWPSAQDVADLGDAVKIAPPNGAEFGKTEVFYLNVTSNDRERSVTLASAIVDGLQERFQQLLKDKATSMIAELEKTSQVADADLAAATQKLAALENNVGSDLAELRILQETPSGNSDLRQKVVAVETELRQAETALRGTIELVSLLRGAREDDRRIAALPDRLLESHKTLSRLIEGLSTARLRTSNLLGSKSADHPLVLAAKAEEAEVQTELRHELSNATRIAEVEERLGRERVAALQVQLSNVQKRLERLAGLRAEYANRVAEAKSRTTLAEEARRNLAEAHASQAAARSASLIARIDAPNTGTRPIGPSKSATVLLGMSCGLISGLGLVFLFAPAARTPVPTTTEAAPSSEASSSSPSKWASRKTESVEAIVKASGGLSLKDALSKIHRDSQWN
jgi:uncharacterized protein involved in exopolysaccharide biosynthesis